MHFKPQACADPEIFVRWDALLTAFFFFFFFFFFLVNEGRGGSSTTISGPSSASQRNGTKCRFAGVPMLAQH